MKWIKSLICKSVLSSTSPSSLLGAAVMASGSLEFRRKVVSYCKRHLAQEQKAKENTDSKSYKSLKNWGHDALKT